MEATWNHGGHCRSANANKDAPPGEFVEAVEAVRLNLFSTRACWGGRSQPRYGGGVGDLAPLLPLLRQTATRTASCPPLAQMRASILLPLSFHPCRGHHRVCVSVVRNGPPPWCSRQWRPTPRPRAHGSRRSRVPVLQLARSRHAHLGAEAVTHDKRANQSEGAITMITRKVAIERNARARLEYAAGRQPRSCFFGLLAHHRGCGAMSSVIRSPKTSAAGNREVAFSRDSHTTEEVTRCRA